MRYHIMSDHEGAVSPSVAALAAEAEQTTVAREEAVHLGETATEAVEAARDNLEDTLFGEEEDEEEQVQAVRRNSDRQEDGPERRPAANDEDDEDDEDEGIRRKVRRPRQRVASASASPPPTGCWRHRRPLRSFLPQRQSLWPRGLARDGRGSKTSARIQGG